MHHSLSQTYFRRFTDKWLKREQSNQNTNTASELDSLCSLALSQFLKQLRPAEVIILTSSLVAATSKYLQADSRLLPSHATTLLCLSPLVDCHADDLLPELAKAAKDQSSVALYYKRLLPIISEAKSPALQEELRHLIIEHFVALSAPLPYPNAAIIELLLLLYQALKVDKSDLLFRMRMRLLPDDYSPYKLLGFTAPVSLEQLKRAIKQQLKIFHPDLLVQQDIHPLIRPLLEEKFHLLRDTFEHLEKPAA